GFEKVVFVINKKNEEAFKEVIIDRLKPYLDVSYVFQETSNVPDKYAEYGDRTKPWGTAHAVLSAKDSIEGSFAVINADDFYGREAFEKIFNFLDTTKDDDKFNYTMIGYLLKNTVTDNGYVSRGVCELDGEEYLVSVNERTHIEKMKSSIAYTEDNGKDWVKLPENSIVSMNLWGFSHSMLDAIEEMFPKFLEESIKNGNIEKGEFYLPSVVTKLLKSDLARVKVLKSHDKWYGVTYKEDKPDVMAAIQKMKDEGTYPNLLWK
ncbi:MAG: nucleotidyltransferase, partial [Lachnospiraceae bacterium]|nr:nucleotidyltransferase [Lachnospiraceae bacterium]